MPNWNQKPVDKYRAGIYYEEDYEAHGESFLSRTVYESEPGPETVDTGLLDSNGKPITRSREKRTYGYVKF